MGNEIQTLISNCSEYQRKEELKTKWSKGIQLLNIKKKKEKGKYMKPHKSEEIKKHNETSYKKIWSKQRPWLIQILEWHYWL